MDRGSCILPEGVWDDVKGMTCMHSKGFDGSIGSVMAILINEEMKDEEKTRDVSQGQNSLLVSPADAEGEVEMDIIRRRKKPKTSQTVYTQQSQQKIPSAPAPVNNTRAGESKLDKKKAKEAAALARLSANLSFLGGGGGSTEN